MCPQEGSLHGYRNSLPDPLYDPEHLKLVLCPESVSALDFHRSGSLGHYFMDTGEGLAEELVLGRVVQKVSGIQYSTTPCGNLLVTQTCNLVPEFSVPAAGIDNVGVRVAECRHYIASFGIDYLVRIGFGPAASSAGGASRSDSQIALG